MSMGIKEKILTTVYHFYTYLKGTYVTNLTSTSSDVPLAASQGKALNDAIENFYLRMYPVNSIYISTSSTNPNVNFGGTWSLFGTGKVPMGVTSVGTTAEQTGGSKTSTLTTLPKHSHTGNSHTHNYVGTHAHTATAHTHSMAHTHSHTHTVSISATLASAGAHTHTIAYHASKLPSGTAYGQPRNSSGATSQGYTTSVYSPTNILDLFHTVSINSSTTGSSGAVASSIANTCSGGSGSTTTASAGATCSGGSTTSSTGSGSAISIVQPYITCYMWKRTA